MKKTTSIFLLALLGAIALWFFFFRAPSFKKTLSPIASFPGLTGQVNVPKLASQGNIVYVVDDKAGFTIWDLTTPKNPVQIGTSLEKLTNIFRIKIQEPYLFVADENNSLILDITNPTEPIRLKSEDPKIPQYYIYQAYDIVIANNWIYYSGLQGLKAMPIGGYWVEDASINLDEERQILSASLAMIDQKYLVAISRSKENKFNFFIWELLENQKPKLIYKGKINAYLDDIVIKNKISYIGSSDKGVFVYDFSQPKNPKRVFHFKGIQAFHLNFFENILMVQYNAHAFYTFDISDPTHPKPLAQLKTEASGITALSTNTFVIGTFRDVMVVE